MPEKADAVAAPFGLPVRRNLPSAVCPPVSPGLLARFRAQPASFAWLRQGRTNENKLLLEWQRPWTAQAATMTNDIKGERPC